ncbi:MAG: EF-hand domain-containing protein [bacterium]|nr:EF-hand domain-containing protein [bacterium]
MGKRLDGTSMFTGVNAGLGNAFSLLSSQYSDGITLENLTSALSNTNIINSPYGSTFASYLTNNFNSVDTDKDGIISANEIQKLMNRMATQGLTREQITALAGCSGLTSLQETVLSHFDDIDKNHDGKVTNQEIQSYGVESDVHKQKVADINRVIKNMSMYYDVDTGSEGSMLDYKYLTDTNDK